MAKPYSEDLRTRVVEAINAGATIPEADTSNACGLSISSESCASYEGFTAMTGSVNAAKCGGYKDFVLDGA